MSTDDPVTASDALDDPDPGPVEGVVAAGERRHRPWWQEALVLVAVALVLAIVVKAFFAQAFYIPSGSMEPGLVKDDRIVVEKVSAWSGSPSRGDVVVFEDPGGWLGPDAAQTGGLVAALSAVGLYPTAGHLVKRVIGVAGDVITCCDDEGRISVNGVPLDEDDYIRLGPDDRCNGPMVPCDWSAGPVPDGEIFVMGDNRGSSGDSTVHLCLPGETDCQRDPFVDVDLVVGTVVAVAWPPGRAGRVGDVDSFDAVPGPQG